MKKLSKLKLKQFHEMSDFEMRNVVGGNGGYSDPCFKPDSGYGKCKLESCTTSSGASGKCKVRQAETQCRCLE